MDEKHTLIPINTFFKFQEKIAQASAEVKMPIFKKIGIYGTHANPIFDITSLGIPYDAAALAWGLHKFEIQCISTRIGLTKLGINTILAKSTHPDAALLMVFVNILLHIDQSKGLRSQYDIDYDKFALSERAANIVILHAERTRALYRPIYLVDDGKHCTLLETKPELCSEVWYIEKNIKMESIFDELAYEYPHATPGTYAASLDSIYTQIADYITKM